MKKANNTENGYNKYFDLTDEEFKKMVEAREAYKKRQAILEEHPYKISQHGKAWYSCLPNPAGKGRGKQFCRSTREKVEDVIIAYYKDKERTKTVEQIYEEARERKSSEGSILDSTVTRYNTDFRRFYGDWADREIKSVTADELREHLREQKIEKNLTTKGYSNLLVITKMIWNHAKYVAKLVDLNVDEVIKSVNFGKNAFRNTPAEKEDFFREDDYINLIEYFKEGEMTAKELGILLMAATGLRVGELVALKWSDYNPDYRELFVQRTESDHTSVIERTKTAAGRRRVSVPEKAVWIFDELKKCTLENPDNYIFYEIDHRKPANPAHRIRAAYIRKRLYKACEEIGGRKKGCHALRKTYASILRDESLPVKYITDSMGHTSLATTDRFYSKPRQSAMTKAQIIDSVDEFAIFAKNA